MLASQLITIIREDYLNDTVADYCWSDAFLLRSLAEAERQACNRSKLIFDDTTSAYTQIALKNGTTTYSLSPKVNYLEAVRFEGKAVTQKSKSELERVTADWRSQTGMKGKPVEYVVRGRTIRFIPSPDASKDATFIQASAPASGMVTNDTWWDTANSLLYIYTSGTWTLSATATIGTVNLEVFRSPDNDAPTTSYEPEIAEEYQRDLIYWILHEAYKKRDIDAFDQEKSDYFLARFTEVFGEYVPADVRLNQMEENPVLTARPIAYNSNLTRSSVSDDDWDK